MRLFRFLVLPLLLLCPAKAASRLTNVSVRSVAGAGADTLIVGFTLSGSGGKSMLVRGIGPALADFGLPNVVIDPELKLYNQGSALLAANDNWNGGSALAATFASVGAFNLKPDSRDAALQLELPAGSYSAHLGAAGSQGVALVEVYDAAPGAPGPGITNLSARSLADTGASVLTAGFVIQGDTPQMVLIRAVGPSLAALGVSGALANPQLKLFTQAGDELATNDNWPTAAKWDAVFAAAGAFPLPSGSRDAALVARLTPGAYTVQASSTDATRGVALLEIYNVPSLPAGSPFIEPVDNSAAAAAHAEQFDQPHDTTPRQLTPVFPPVPVDLLIAGVDVRAVIQFVVHPDGFVTDPIVVRASDVRLGELSASAVLRWTYQPARFKGQPVRSVERTTFSYKGINQP